MDGPRPGSSGLRGKRVLFYSVSYRPEHAGIGPYAAAAAEHLAKEGASVSVVAGLPHYPSWRVAPEDRWRLRRHEVVGGLPVTRLRQVVSRKQTALTRGVYELSFFLHGLFVRRTWQKADVVMAVVPSLAGGALAMVSAARNRVPLIVMVQDLTAAGARQSGMLGGRFASALVGNFESRLFRKAAAVGLVHDSLAESCLAMGVSPERLHVVPNWSLREPQPQVERVAGTDWTDRYVVLHAGNMGFKQGLEVVVDAARLAHQRGHDDLLFVLMGDGSRRDRLEHLAADLPTIRIMDPVADEAFPGVLGAADLVLVTQRAEVHDMSVPSKLTAYFNAGKAVVCSVSPDCGTALEVRRSGGGVVVPPQDPEALLKAVLELKQSPDRVRELDAAGRAYALEFLSPKEGLDRVVALVTAGMHASA